MLDSVKKALRITTDAFDDELTYLIVACINEMTGLGILVHTDASTEAELVEQIKLTADQDGFPAQIRLAIISFCKWRFGDSDGKDEWRGIYDREVAQLKTMTGFTDWEA